MSEENRAIAARGAYHNEVGGLAAAMILRARDMPHGDYAAAMVLLETVTAVVLLRLADGDLVAAECAADVLIDAVRERMADLANRLAGG